MGTHRTPWTQPHFPEVFLSTSAASQSGIGQAGLRWGQADLRWGRQHGQRCRSSRGRATQMAFMELERPFPVWEGLKGQLKRLALPPEGNQKTLKNFFVCQLRSFSLQEEKKLKQL